MRYLKSPLLLLTGLFFILSVLIAAHEVISYYSQYHFNDESIKENVILIKEDEKLSTRLSDHPIHITKFSSNSNHDSNNQGDIEGRLTLALVLVTLSTLTYQAHRSRIEDAQKNSKFYLKNYKQTSEMILNRLNSDTPTRRISWVTASKMAHMLIKLEDKITEKADKEMLETHQRNLAHDINEFFLDKPAIYFAGRDQAKPWDDAFPTEIIGSSGSIPKCPQLLYIPEETIRSILDITNPIWEKEVGYKYCNKEEFESVMKLTYPCVFEYLSELKKRHL